MKVFEVTGKGYDLETDATDNRLFWVQAADEKSVRAAVDGCEAEVCEAPSALVVELRDRSRLGRSIDFTLPADLSNLRKALFAFVYPELIIVNPAG